METVTLVVEEHEAGIRLDKFLSIRFPAMSRSSLQKLCEENFVLLEQHAAAKNYKTRTADRITVLIPEPVELNIEAENIPLDIVFEDRDLLIINKEKGMVVHPAAGNYQHTLVNALLYHCRGDLSGINGVIRPGIVHRIDKDTSGLLIVAKNDRSHLELSKQIKEHSFFRAYQAVVYGTVKEEEGTIDLPIGRHPIERKKMTVSYENSKRAVTHFRVLERFSGFTHLELQLETGRTHQIRVHMAHQGHPVAGDPVYGPKKIITELNGQCLHAKKIGFLHPTTHENMLFDSELPEYFQKFLKKLSQ